MVQTQAALALAASIDVLTPVEAMDAMLASHRAALEVVVDAFPALEEAAGLVAQTLGSGHTLYYAAAGSSGLMALADACELPGTFGVAPHQVRIFMAGGVPTDGRMPGVTEDDIEQAQNAVGEMSAGDLAIVLSASGTTPFALTFANAAKAANHPVIGLANVASAPLLSIADIAVPLPTGPEVVDGSTRLGAGTAQKAALNMISTRVGVLLGHVHEGLMVNFVPDNIKLRQRAVNVVAQVADVQRDVAKHALEQANYAVKPAILAARGLAPSEAKDALQASNGHLRPCLQRLMSKKANNT